MRGLRANIDPNAILPGVSSGPISYEEDPNRNPDRALNDLNGIAPVQKRASGGRYDPEFLLTWEQGTQLNDPSQGRFIAYTGALRGMLNTAAYQQLKRISTYLWKQQNRIGRKPAQQYLGPGADQITLKGGILPHWRGGYHQIDLMRTQAGWGKPRVLLEGYGGDHGWAIR